MQNPARTMEKSVVARVSSPYTQCHARVFSNERRCLRVLGVDPAAAGATGYGVIESEAALQDASLRRAACNAQGSRTFSPAAREIHANA